MYSFMSYIKFWKVFGHDFFRYSLCPLSPLLSFWHSHYVYVGRLNGVPQVLGSVFVCVFFFLLKNLCFSDWILSLGLSLSSLIFFFCLFKSDTEHSSESFISVILLFSSKYSILFLSLFIVSIFLFLSFYLCLFTHCSPDFL